MNKKHICCRHVYNKQRSILLVFRAKEYFQFLCGGEDDDEPELIDIDTIVSYDPSIQFLLDLKINHVVQRASIRDYWSLKYYEDGFE